MTREEKLHLIFGEIVSKDTVDGKVRQEMVSRLQRLSFRGDLRHSSSIRVCLECRHADGRRNALWPIFTIEKNFDSFIPDAPTLIGK